MVRRFLILASISTVLLGGLLLVSPTMAQDKSAKTPPAKEATKTEATKTEAPKTEAPPAKETPAKAPPAKEKGETAAATDSAAAEAAFQTKFEAWKTLIKHLRQLRTDFQTADPTAMEAMAKDWDATVAKAEQALPGLIDAVTAAYQAAPNEDRVKTNFLAKIVSDYIARDIYEPALKVGNILVDNDCDLPAVYRDTGTAAFALNEYDRMAVLMEKAEKLNALPGDAARVKAEMNDYREFWKAEQKLRAKEAKADDLPRVKLTTTKGVIVVELFENEAPDTVGNFISLVKSGFYDNLTFHRVIAGFMAQGGCPEGDGTGGPGYSIYDECDKPGARKHFRGVLSMAKTNAPNSGGSQFFITFRPTPNLNGKHTVFGRVIEGMDVVAKLKRRDPQAKDAPEPDRILKAEVIRDRGHEYLPKKVE